MQDKPVLIFAYGNISRGDDALAPLLLEHIQQLNIVEIAGHPLKFLLDYQILVEHVMDLQGCERVLLIDADAGLNTSFHFYPVSAMAETLYTTHGMSPATLLHTYHKVFNEQAPQTSMLAIQGCSFELGDSLSETAQINLKLTTDFILNLLQEDFSLWDNLLMHQAVT